jgi:metal-dependent amidase/aminoacylase/carboxypeptidase family protein
VEGTAKLYGAKVKLVYERNYPVTKNHPRQTAFAAAVASQVVGSERVDTASRQCNSGWAPIPCFTWTTGVLAGAAALLPHPPRARIAAEISARSAEI